MIELCRNRNRQSPLMHGHLGQTLVSDMTFYCRPDVVGDFGFWSVPELKTVSRRPSRCQMKLVAALHDSSENEKKILISLGNNSF